MACKNSRSSFLWGIVCVCKLFFLGGQAPMRAKEIQKELLSYDLVHSLCTAE